MPFSSQLRFTGNQARPASDSQPALPSSFIAPGSAP